MNDPQRVQLEAPSFGVVFATTFKVFASIFLLSMIVGVMVVLFGGGAFLASLAS